MKRILVTGGAGFIGANLCRRLLQKSEENFVICLDNFYTGQPQNIEALKSHPRFSFVYGDVTNPIAETADEIYHLACPASPPHYQKDPIYTTKTCVFGTLHVLEAARQNGARVLFAGTSEVYGEPTEHPQCETYRGNVNCTGIRACYDEGKRCAESLVFDFHRMYGVCVKAVRIFNTYGPYMDKDDGRVVSNFITQSLAGEPLTVYGDGTQTRSLCYVDDLVDGLLRMMASPEEVTGPVNLGNSEEYTVKEIAEMIAQFAGGEGKIEYRPLPKDDPTQRRPNIEKAQRLLGWTPKIGAEEGLKRTIAYFRGKTEKTL